jgi:hypothetical protein
VPPYKKNTYNDQHEVDSYHDDMVNVLVKLKRNGPKMVFVSPEAAELLDEYGRYLYDGVFRLNEKMRL